MSHVVGEQQDQVGLTAELDVLRRLHDIVAVPAAGGLKPLLEKTLDHLIAIHRADFGNVQLMEPDGALVIVAQRGFEEAFLARFDRVRAGDPSACGMALKQQSRVVIDDVRTTPEYAPCLEAAQTAGYRAVQSTPLFSMDGKILGMLSTHFRQPRAFSEHELQMTDLFAAQAASAIERLRSAEALRDADRRKDEFLATLAHELRNPLAPIRNGLQITRLATKHDLRLQQTLDMMSRQLSHMVRLVDDLLDLGRIQSGKLELDLQPVSVAEVIMRSVESVRASIDAHRQRLDLEISDDNLIVSGDMERLSQVFANILSNAAKYSDAGGRIHVSLEREEDEAVIRVTDTGVGIASDDLTRVFDLFSQVRAQRGHAEGGLGIGLSLVKRLVMLHGGAVSAWSAGVRQGSTFTVRLPLAQAARAVDELRAAPVVAPPPRERGSWRILVVDDNADAALSLAALLRIDGHETEVAHDGERAVEEARNFQPHVVILDIGMPRMDGIEAAQRLRELPEGNEMVLVALTGFGQSIDRQRTRAAGFDHHLVKPVDPTMISALIAQRLEAPARTQ